MKVRRRCSAGAAARFGCARDSLPTAVRTAYDPGFLPQTTGVRELYRQLNGSLRTSFLPS